MNMTGRNVNGFLDEDGGELPTDEHMEELVGQEQARRIRLVDKKRRREAHEKMLEEQKQEEKEKKLEAKKNNRKLAFVRKKMITK